MRVIERECFKTEFESRKNDFNGFPDFYSVISHFTYCLVARKNGDIENNLVYIQLKHIRDLYKDSNKGQFEFATMDSYRNKHAKIKNQQVMFLIRADKDLLDHTAEKMGLVIYNQKYKFLEAYERSRGEEFERFRGVHVQQIILFLLELEFDIDSFKAHGLLLDHFPLHNYLERKQIREYWHTGYMIKETIKDSILYITSDHHFLKPLTTIAFYFGTKVNSFYSEIPNHYTLDWMVLHFSLPICV